MGHTRAVGKPRWNEDDLIKAGFQKNVNTLGVIYYVNPDDSELDWIKDTDGPYWHQVPWHLVENPYVDNNDPGPTRATNTGQQGREITAAALGARIAAIYGEVLVGGDVFLQKSPDPRYYYQAFGLGHGENQSCQQIFAAMFGQQKYPITLGNATFSQTEFKNGAITQTASSIIAAAKGLALGSTPVYPGLSYMAAVWIYDGNNMPEVPGETKFLVRGRKCYDARLDVGYASTGTVTRNATTVVWTQNDALILADYMVDTWFGLGLGDTGLDWDSVISAANYCDVVVATDSVTDVVMTLSGGYIGGNYAAGVIPTVTFTAAPGGGRTATGTAIMAQKPDRDGGYWYVAGVSITDPGAGYLADPTPTFSAGGVTATGTSVRGEKRHMMNIALRREATHKANIDTLRQHFRCSFTERKGRIAFVIDQAKASVYTFTKDNARAISGSRSGTSKVPTASDLTFTNPKKDWAQDHSYAYTDNVRNGVDEYRPMEWVLDGCTRANEAARNNTYLLGKRRSTLGTQLELITIQGTQLERGDRVTVIFDVLAMPNGVDFILETVKDNGNGRFLCDVSYYNAALYTDTVGVVETSVNLGVADPYNVLGAPTGLVVTEQVDEFVPGVYTPKLKIGFTPVGGPFYGGTVCKYSVNGGSTIEVPAVITGPITIPITEGPGSTVVIDLYSKNILSGQLGTAALHGTYTTYNPSTPEPVGYVTYDNNGGVYWSKPPVRTALVTSAWAHTNCTGVDFTKIDDGITTVPAITVPANAVGFEIRWTAAGATSEITLTLNASFTTWASFPMQYWNGSAWVTPPSYHQTDRDGGVGVVQSFFFATPIGGAGTQWRLAGNNGPVAFTINEVDVYSYGASYPYVKGYLITGLDDKGSLWTKFIDYTPTVAKPIKISEFTYKILSYNSQSSELYSSSSSTIIRVQTVSPTNVISGYGDGYIGASVFAPANLDSPALLGTNSTLSADPPVGDSTHKIATTAWTKANQQLDGPLGVGAAPSGNQIRAKKDQAGGTSVSVENASAAAGVVTAFYQALADVAQLFAIANGSGRATSRFGVTIGGWVELLAASAGMIVGTLGADSLILGTNSTAYLTISSTGVVTLSSSPATSDNSTKVATTAYTKAQMLTGSVSWVPGSIASGSSLSTNITVTGATVGDPVMWGCTDAISAYGTVTVIAEVSSANTVKITITNGNTGGISVTGGNWKVSVSKF